jgi:hypothetical protein
MIVDLEPEKPVDGRDRFGIRSDNVDPSTVSGFDVPVRDQGS